MNYTYIVHETLKDYDNNLYKMIEIRLILSKGKFEHRALPIGLMVSDGQNEVISFITIISGNQKELLTFFTVDAFTGFSNNSKILYGYGGQYFEVAANVNVQNVSPLPALLAGISHQNATNAWLETL